MDKLLKRRAEVIEKVASLSPQVGTALTIAGLIGAGVIVSRFVDKMFEYMDARGLETKAPEYYKKMLDKNPQLMDKDPEEIADLWTTLYKSSPHLAQDPIAAGAFITQSISQRVRTEFGGPTLDTYKTLVDIEDKMLKERKEKPTDYGKLIIDALKVGV